MGYNQKIGNLTRYFVEYYTLCGKLLQCNGRFKEKIIDRLIK